MILNREQIKDAGIVIGAVDASRRCTTYDATIGDIISQGELIEADAFMLEKRGVVWVVSAEEFSFGPSKTGLATLKTTWTHKGVLALNVGVIDPGWKGPLATALVNFSGGRISLKKGDPFFRVMVFSHKETNCASVVKPRELYVSETLDRSRIFATTFLDTHSLVDEVATKVFKFPKLAVAIGWAGLGVALAAIFAPMFFTVWTDSRNEAAEILQLERRVQQLEDQGSLSRDLPRQEPTVQPPITRQGQPGNVND
jgi:deoxycytidine triphosphate deaminase